MGTVNGWDVLLCGSAAEAAKTITAQIASDLSVIDERACSAAQLCEQALLFGYLAISESDSRWLDEAASRLNAASNNVSAQYPIYQFGGLSGIAWTFAHLQQVLGDPSASQFEDDDPLADIHDLLLRRMEEGAEFGPYDLVTGLVGVAVYLLERLPSASAATGLSSILQYLHKRAEQRPAGVAWHTAPELLPEHQRAVSPAGYYNLGLAHGIPGTIRLLVELIDAEIHAVEAYHLLEAAMQWMVSQQMQLPSGLRYPYWVSPTSCPASVRLAWCYGDLGVSAAIYQAGLRTGRTDWTDFASTLMDSTLERPLEEVTAVGLCHGCLGVAHIYRRLFHFSQQESYRIEALRYYQHAIKMLDSKPAHVTYIEAIDTHENSRTILSGPTGVALALLAAVSPVEPFWDRRLLLSGWSIGTKSGISSSNCRFGLRE